LKAMYRSAQLPGTSSIIENTINETVTNVKMDINARVSEN
jgi:hypothetical protein